MAESLSFINLSNSDMPEVDVTKLISICSYIRDNFFNLSPILNEKGSREDISEFCQFSLEKRFASSEKVFSVYIDSTPELHEIITSTTNGAIISGCFYYPSDGFMGWHTNLSSYPLDSRLYLTYNDSEGSRFYYRKDDKILFIEEPVGWSIKYFSVNDIFWHSVISNSNRYSFGFRYLSTG